jgi:hypothetical protein
LTVSTTTQHANRFNNWRDRAASMLRGRANLRGAQQRGNDTMVPLQTPSSHREPSLLRPPALFPNDSGDSGSSVSPNARGYIDSPASATADATRTFFPHTDTAHSAASTGAQPITAQQRRMTRFLAQAEGKHFYLDVIRRALSKRQQQPNGDRYLNDAMIDRWLGEFIATLSRPFVDGMPFEITPAVEAADDAHFVRLTKRLVYLDAPSLPTVSDDDFAEFVRRYPQVCEPEVVRQQVIDFCESLNARRA